MSIVAHTSCYRYRCVLPPNNSIVYHHVIAIYTLSVIKHLHRPINRAILLLFELFTLSVEFPVMHASPTSLRIPFVKNTVRVEIKTLATLTWQSTQQTDYPVLFYLF